MSIASELPPLSIKILLLGESNVGKTSLISRYQGHQHEAENNLMTIGIDIRRVQRKIDGRDITLELWDTAGQQKYKNLPNQYFRGIQAILLIYDISDGQSFVRIQDWLDKVSNTTTDKLCILLIGNKRDKQTQRQVSQHEAQIFCQGMINMKGIQMELMETSAKTGDGVEGMFQRIARLVLTKGVPIVKGLAGGKSVRLEDSGPRLAQETSGCC